MEHPKNGYSLKRGEGTQINFRGTTMTLKAVSEQTDGAYSLIEMLHPPDVGPALHTHPRGAEAFYVLDGSYRIRSGDQVYTATSGDFVFIPKGLPHSYQSGVEGGRVLVMSPAGLEKYFKEVAEVLTTESIPWELEQEIARRHGQEFLEKLQHWGQ